MTARAIAVVAILLGLSAATPYVIEHGPDQSPGWVGYDRDAGIIVYCWVAAAVAGGCLVAHYFWHTFVNKSVRSANCFVQMAFSLLFVYNWAHMWAKGTPTPFTIGEQSGACAGYELYGLIGEVLMYVTGEAKRTDMIFHHLMCVAFTVFTLAVYSQVTVADLFYWHLAWDSISRMLVSNVPWSLRYFAPGMVSDVLFTVVFVWARVIEQVPFVLRLSRADFKFDSLATAGVTFAWSALAVLNVYWFTQLVSVAMGRKKERKEKKTE